MNLVVEPTTDSAISLSSLSTNIAITSRDNKTGQEGITDTANSIDFVTKKIFVYELLAYLVYYSSKSTYDALKHVILNF